MAKLVRHALCLCVFLLTVQGAVFTPKQEQLLKSFITVQHENLREQVPGMTVAVVKGNETWVGAFGLADVETGRAVTTSTLFGIGSITKAFTAQILAQLMDESNGRISWDTPLKDIFGPSFKLADSYLTRHVTIKDMLTHRTGLMTSNLPFFASLPKSTTRQKFVELLQYLPAVSGFRDEWAYNNWMYTLSGRVAEVMGGASWEDLLLTRLLQPLNMTGTKVIGHNGVEVDDANFARPYVWAEDKLTASAPSIYRISPMEAAGAMASSAEDMAKWLRMLLKSGVTDEGRQIVDARLMEQIFDSPMSISRHSPGNKFSDDGECPVFTTIGYGFGWFRGTYQGCEIHWHTGNLHGFTSLATRMPSSDGGLAFFASVNGPGTGLAYSALFNVFDKVVSTLKTPAQVPSNQTRCKHASSVFRSTELDTADLNEPGVSYTSKPTLSPSAFLESSAPENTYKFGFESDMRFVNRPAMGEFVSFPKHFIIRRESKVFQNCGLEHYSGVYRHKLFGDLVIGCDVMGGLTMTYNQLTGSLIGTDRINILLFEAAGPFRHLSKSSVSDPTIYMELHFSKLRRGGSFQKLGITAPDLGEENLLNFTRVDNADEADDVSNEKED